MKKTIILMILIVVGVVAFYGVRYMKTPVTTEQAVRIKYEEVISGEAYIVKSETLHTAPIDGTFYKYAVDGNRVGKNRRIASVYAGNVNTDTLQELNNIDKKIEIARVQSSTKQIEISDSASEESRIAERKNSIIDAVYTGDIASIADYKEEIKRIRSGTDVEDGESELQKLEQQREILESRIGKKRTDIFSQNSGVFIAAVDGYEQRLTPDGLKTMTVDDFNSLEKPQTAVEKSMVQSGDFVCKVVDNNVWYSVVKVKAETLSDEYKEGDKVKIRFNAVTGSEVDAVIYSISEAKDGEILVGVKCDKYLEGIFAQRYTDAEIVLKSYQGFKVPIYAIRVQDGKKGIEVVSGLASIFKPCEIVYTNELEGFVIIDSVEGEASQIESTDRIIIGEK